MTKKDKNNELQFIDKWRSYNKVRDLFWEKKFNVEKMMFKALILKDVLKWLEHDSYAKMETVLKLDIPHKIYESDQLKSGALQNAWLEVLDELKNDGFNVDKSNGGSEYYHLIMNIVSDEEEEKEEEEEDSFHV